MSLTNIWHLRKVAETLPKACDICYKPTTSVLITPDKKDYFYVCQGHLKDRGFCSSVGDDAEAAARKKKEEMDREIELVKKEYEEKIEKKRKKAKEKKNVDEDEKKADNENERAEKDKDERIKQITSQGVAPTNNEDIPRVFSLQKVFYQKRLDRIRNAEMAKRNRERAKNPTVFPSVPTGGLG
ncbi:hypothetical protein MMC12_006615 [Toensbergia leucococca]|nr:hypothetical protein [Toensbergia leucococca]